MSFNVPPGPIPTDIEVQFVSFSLIRLKFQYQLQSDGEQVPLMHSRKNPQDGPVVPLKFMLDFSKISLPFAYSGTLTHLVIVELLGNLTTNPTDMFFEGVLQISFTHLLLIHWEFVEQLQIFVQELLEPAEKSS